MPDYTPVPSKAALFGHPIHPMLVVFPIAFLIGALATDLTWWGTNDPFWALASRWLIGAGLVMGILAALAGLTDFVSREEVRSHTAAIIHFGGNALVLIAAAINLAFRWSDAAGAILPEGVILSAITTGLLVITGWLGGELAYRYGIGQTATPSVTAYEPPTMTPATPSPSAANEPARPEARRRGTR